MTVFGQDPNVIPVCSDCTDERSKLFRDNIRDHASKLNHRVSKSEPAYVKKAFSKGTDVNEYMWVKVTDFDPATNKVTGTLDNIPTLVDNISHGDEVTFLLADAIDIL